MGGGIVIAACCAALVATLTDAREVRLAGRDVHLTDVAKVRGAGAERAGGLIIARLPAGNRETIRRDRLVELVRRAVPAIEIRGGAAGEILLAAPAPVQPEPRVAEPYVPERPAVQRGQRLTLVSRSGAVTVVREVTALQPARKAQRRLFVETADGAVLSAPLAPGDGK